MYIKNTKCISKTQNDIQLNDLNKNNPKYYNNKSKN